MSNFNRSKLSITQILDLHSQDVSMDDIAQLANVTRQAIHNKLKQAEKDGIKVKPRRSTKTSNCLYCNIIFTVPSSRGSNYCSVKCFHKARAVSNEQFSRGGELRFHRREARRILIESGVMLTTDQVVHHIDGDPSNNLIKNLMVFDSHSQHMKFHHSLDKKALHTEDKTVKVHRNQRENWSIDKKHFYTTISLKLRNMTQEEINDMDKSSYSDEIKQLINNYKSVFK